MFSRYLTLMAASAALALGGIPMLAAAEGQLPDAAVQQQGTTLEAFTADWPEVSRQAAQQTGSKYGAPDGVTPDLLQWTDAGPWNEIIVYREPIPHHFPKEHEDVLEQVIDYDVPPDKFDELAEFDGSVIADRTKGTLAARCDREPMNYLALNLAHDIITDAKKVEEARQFYTDTVAAFMQGEQHPYTQDFQFEVPDKSGDPDEVTLGRAQQEEAKRG